MYPMSKVATTDWSRGAREVKRRGGEKGTAFRRGTCHFEARPWGGGAYHWAEIFQQTSLSFHLPNADGGPTPPDYQDCNAASNYRALFSTLAISTARDSPSATPCSISANAIAGAALDTEKELPANPQDDKRHFLRNHLFLIPSQI